MSISIVIPAYNEEKRIGRTLEEYSKFFNGLLKKKELKDYCILVVINGTTDKTEDVVKSWQKRNKRIRYLNFKRGGKGFAVTEGFRESLKAKEKFELIGFVDADMATSPEQFLKLAVKMKNADGAIADRYLRGSIIISKNKLRRMLVSRIFNFIVRIFFRFPYTDTQVGAKIFKRKVIEKIIGELGMTLWAFDIDLLYLCKKRGFRIMPVPTIWREVEGSKLNVLRASIGMLFAIIQLRILKSRFKGILKFLKPIIGIIYKAIKGR